MKVLVTGAAGMLAHTLVPTLRVAGHQVLALDRTDLDVTDQRAVDRVLRSERPDVVVQCAAYTAVDRAEAEEEVAHRVNALATGYLAGSCDAVGATLVYPSSDYVFSGAGERRYAPADETGPINAYGRSKLAGERAAARCGRFLVIRTSWLYGAGGPNFVETIRRLASERETLEVVDDQVGRPTSTLELSRAISRLLGLGAAGIFHVAGGGAPTTWYGFAGEIVRGLGLANEVKPVPSSRYPRAARRPAHAVLDCAITEELLDQPFADWRVSLAEYLQGSGVL
jgi:dTDP-4-dehydrorhamnose reductase